MKKRIIIVSTMISLAMSIPAYAGATHSYNVGTDLGDIDTTQEVIDVAGNLFYAGYTPQIVVSNIGKDTITEDWLNSGVVYLAGHGSTVGNDVLWINNTTGLNYRVCNYLLPSDSTGRNIEDINISNCKLAIMAACYSGVVCGIADSFQESGADCSIGWKDVVSNVTLARYNKILTSYLAQGMTIQNSIKGANADIVDEEDINYDENVFDYQTYGSGVYNSIKREMRSSGLKEELIEKNIITSNPEDVEYVLDTYTQINDCEIEYVNGDDSQITAYITENVDPNFDESLFEKKEIKTISGDDSDMIVTYRYKLGDVVSDFGYNINITDFKAISYKKTGVSLYDYNEPLLYSVEEIKKDKLERFNAKKANSTEDIVEQDISVKFDSKDKKYVYYIDTVYETEDGGIYSVRIEC